MMYTPTESCVQVQFLADVILGSFLSMKQKPQTMIVGASMADAAIAEDFKSQGIS